MRIKSIKFTWRWIAALVVVALLVLEVRRLPVIAWLESVATPLRNLGWPGVALYTLIYAVAGILCLPCAPLTLAGGYIFGTWKGFVAVHVGSVAAAAASFALGRVAGRKHAAEWLRRSERFHYLDDAIAREGWKIVGLLRLQALPFGLTNYLYGMTRIGFWHYLLASVVAMAPSHLIYVHLAAVGGEHLSGRAKLGPLELVGPVLALVSLIVVTVLLSRMVRKHEAEKRRNAVEGEPELCPPDAD